MVANAIVSPKFYTEQPPDFAPTLVERESAKRLTLRLRINNSWTIPQWFSKSVEQLKDLLKLAPGWDGYGAEPISRVAFHNAVRFLATFPSLIPPPQIVPTSEGGIQLEWHKQPVNVEIEFSPDDSIRAYYPDRRSEPIEEELTIDELLLANNLVNVIASLPLSRE